MAHTRTSLVIPCFVPTERHLEMTLQSLESLDHGKPDEMILVDDGSSMRIPPHRNVTHIIRKAKNEGYAQAVNAGLRKAMGSIIIVANNDIFYLDGWLDGILSPFEKGYDFGLIRVSDADGLSIENRYSENDRLGSLWAVKRSVQKKLGLLDTRYGRGYFSDTDYWRRAINAGYRIGKNHVAVVEHTGHATQDYFQDKSDDYARATQAYLDKWGFVD